MTASRLPGSDQARAAVAGLIGTTIEWYDFYLFGSAAALVFNDQFFPRLSPTTGTLASFATFGVGFAARPVGAVVFGHFGDRIGRKQMLVLSLLLMGAGTFLIGVLPGYASIGLWAPILLVVLRLVQGFAVGGQWGGAVLMSVEHAPPARRALFGSFPQAGLVAGAAIASAAFIGIEQLPISSLDGWGWRIPFWGSALLVAVGLYARTRLNETPEFEATAATGRSAFPLLDVLRNSPRGLLAGILLQAAAGIPFYLASVFALSYGTDHLRLSARFLQVCVIIACVIDFAAIPAVAVLADRVGARRILGIGAVWTVLAAFPFFWLFNTGNTALVLIAMLLMLSVGLPLTYAPMSSFIAGLFPASLRYSGSSVAYQAGGAMTSGPAPFIAAALLAATGSWYLIASYVALAGVVSLAGVTVVIRGRYQVSEPSALPPHDRAVTAT